MPNNLIISVFFISLLAFLFCQCSNSTEHHDINKSNTTIDAGDGADDTDSENGENNDSSDGGDSNNNGECSEEAELVYVISADGKLYRFNPPEKSFELVSALNCESAGSPFSMAVANNDIAYVLYSESLNCVGINAVDIITGECLGLIDFECDQYGFSYFGMGFATNGPDVTEETLYVGKSHAEENTLASLNVSSWLIDPIGPISGSPELTGNKAGELWAFYAWLKTPKISLITKDTGEENDYIYLPDFGDIEAFAFATWGGEFYIFEKNSDKLSFTTVHKVFEGANGPEIMEWVNEKDVGVVVVGAGVSTCAPTEIE